MTRFILFLTLVVFGCFMVAGQADAIKNTEIQHLHILTKFIAITAIGIIAAVTVMLFTVLDFLEERFKAIEEK